MLRNKAPDCDHRAAFFRGNSFKDAVTTRQHNVACCKQTTADWMRDPGGKYTYRCDKQLRAKALPFNIFWGRNDAGSQQ